MKSRNRIGNSKRKMTNKIQVSENLSQMGGKVVVKSEGRWGSSSSGWRIETSGRERVKPKLMRDAKQIMERKRGKSKKIVRMLTSMIMRGSISERVGHLTISRFFPPPLNLLKILLLLPSPDEVGASVAVVVPSLR